MCRPFCLLGESYGDAGMGVARIFGACAALLFASSVAASTIDVGPSNWRNYGPSATHTTGGVQSTFGQQVRLPPTISGPTRVLPVSRNPVIPYGSIANGLRNFTRVNPASVAASAAVTALFLGLDWVFDEELDSWMKEGIETAPFDERYIHWKITTSHGQNFYNGAVGESPIEACRNGIRNAREVIGVRMNSQITFSCRYITSIGTESTSAGGQRQGSGCPEGFVYNEGLAACAAPGVIDLDPSDWTTLENSLPSSNPDTVADAARDTMRRQGAPLPGYTDNAMDGPSSVSGPTTTSTSTDPVTGDTTVTETSTQTYINYGDTTITTTNTTTSTTYQNGQETSTTVETETPGELPVSTGGGAAGDWPGFCDWATVVCDWLDWTQEEPPPEQDLPAVIDDDFYQEKNISFGSKSCPEPYGINLTPFMDSQVSISFQPLCDFAGLIYYMVMAASYIIAAYITIGVARNA